MNQFNQPPTNDNLESGVRLARLGILVNAALAAVKILAGVFGQSYALIADGIESTLDVGSSLVIWGALKLALKPPDEDHPYGHGKAEPMAAMVVSLTVIFAAMGLAVASVHKIFTPHHTPAPFTLIVLVGVIIIKELLFRRVNRAADAVGSSAVKADAWHHRADALTSGAAFVGISIALIGGKGWENADNWAALFACCIIGYNGVHLLKPALAEIMDSAPPREFAQEIRAAAMAVSGVGAVEQCKARKMGAQFYVDLHIEVDGTMTVSEGHRIAHRVKDALRAKFPHVADVLVHVEPMRVRR